MGKYDLLLGLGLVGGLALVLFTQQGNDLVLKPFGQLLNKIPFFSIDNPSANAGGYAVTANNLPFDPNNYYLPPRRDRSIAP